MLVFFDLHKLKTYAGGDYRKVFELLSYMDAGPKPKWFLYPAKILTGPSFILNARPLSANLSIHDPNHVMQYLNLAAYRDYATYKLYAMAYLDLSFFPDISLDTIKHNPL